MLRPRPALRSAGAERMLRRSRVGLERADHGEDLAAQVVGALEAGVGALGQAAQDDRLDPRIEVDADRHLSRRAGRHVEVQPHVLAEGVGAEQRLAREDLVHDRAERIDIGARIDREPARLLRRHVRRRADHRADRREIRVGHVLVDQLGDAEIEDLHQIRAVLGAPDDDVVRFEIAVNDADRVRRRQAVADLRDHAERAAERDAARGPHEPPQAVPGEQLHDDEDRPVLQLDVVDDIDDVAVADEVDRARLLEEARDRVATLRVVLAEELERDVASELGVLGAVDASHAAPADDLGEPVRSEDFPDSRLRLLGGRPRLLVGRAQHDGEVLVLLHLGGLRHDAAAALRPHRSTAELAAAGSHRSAAPRQLGVGRDPAHQPG